MLACSRSWRNATVTDGAYVVDILFIAQMQSWTQTEFY